MLLDRQDRHFYPINVIVTTASFVWCKSSLTRRGCETENKRKIKKTVRKRPVPVIREEKTRRNNGNEIIFLTVKPALLLAVVHKFQSWLDPI